MGIVNPKTPDGVYKPTLVYCRMGFIINRFSDDFFPSTSCLWNSLPSAVFPASFNLPSFKRQVYHHLRDRMAWFFFFLLLFLDILQNFILYITVLFLFSRDADSRKGTLCPFCVPIHKKKKKKIPFPTLHLSRNAAKVSESLKVSDQHMAKRYWAVFIHKQPFEGFQTLILPPLASLSPLCIADFEVAASSRKMETKEK